MRLVGYIRVSRVAGREGDTFISPALQREQIAALAKARGHDVTEWIEDLDESGGKWERPGFQRALEMVENGQVDGIAVAKLDRFARSLADALRAIERINQADGDLVSVADNFDTTTPMGRAMLQITLVFAELERERQRDGFRVAKVRAIERGIHISTLVPVGYRRGPDRRLVPVAREAKVVREVFLRRARGDSWTELAQHLDKKLPRKGAWPRQTVAKLVANRVYIGEAHQGDIVNANAHPAVVSRAEWEAAQQQQGEPVARSGTLLAGVLVCSSCGWPMGRVSSLDYGCRARRSDGVCDRPVTVRVALADEHVEGVFLEWASKQPYEIVAASLTDDLQAAVGQLEAAEAELAAYRDAQLVSIIGRDAYTSGLRERAQRIDETRALVQRAQTATFVPHDHFDAVSLWPSLTVRERRALLVSGVEEVIVWSGGGPVTERLTVVFRDGEDEMRVAGAQDGK